MPTRPLEHLSDGAIIRMFRLGIRSAQAEAFLRWRPQIYRFFTFRGVPHEEAEALTQETFLILLTKAKKFRCKAFIRGIARKLWLRWMDANPAAPDHDATSHEDLFADTQHRETLGWRWRCLARRKRPRCTAMIALVEDLGHGTRDTALILELKHNTLKTRMQRAQKALHACMGRSNKQLYEQHLGSKPSTRRTRGHSDVGVKTDQYEMLAWYWRCLAKQASECIVATLIIEELHYTDKDAARFLDKDPKELKNQLRQTRDAMLACMSGSNPDLFTKVFPTVPPTNRDQDSILDALERTAPEPDEATSERMYQRYLDDMERVAVPRRWLMWSGYGLGTVLVAALALFVVLPDDVSVLKGDTPPPKIELRYGTYEEGKCVGAPKQTLGGCAQIDVTAYAEGTLWVWAEHPGGTMPPLKIKAQEGINTLMNRDEVAIYPFEHAGLHRFFVSAKANECETESCTELLVEVP